MAGADRQPRIPIAISSPHSPDEYEEYYFFRWELLRAPWNQPLGSERDRYDAVARHLLGRNDSGEIVAVGRIHFPESGLAQIRYMATREDHRGLGIGSSILGRLEKVAIDRGVQAIFLNARAEAVSFYERLGYKVRGKGPTLFDEIEHQTMTKTL